MSARIKELEEEVWFYNVNVNYEPRMRTSHYLFLLAEGYKASTFGARCQKKVIFLYNIFSILYIL